MKFIFSFLFAFIFISPVIAGYNTGTTTNTCLSQSSDTCNSTPGCEWSNGECSPCQSGTYSAVDDPTCLPCEDGFNSDWATQHKAHPDGASSCDDWECIDGYFPVDTNNDNIPDECSLCDPSSKPEHADFYNDSCNWRCIQGYYKDGNSCTQCPTGSDTTAPGATMISQCRCGSDYYLDSGQSACLSCPTHATSPAGSTMISQCQCNSGYYRGGTNMDECIQCTGELSCSGTGLTYSNTSTPNGFSCSDGWQLVPDDTTHTYSCQSCRDPHATLENGNCKCNQNYYGTIAGLGTQCNACPLHSTTDGAGSTSISACKCNIGYYDTESDTNSVSCSACPNNSTTDDAGSTGISACKCNIGYYDAESDANSVSCTKCPIGMTTVTLVNGNPTNTTTNGATSIEHCAMLATSEFCFTNPNSTNRQLICTPLIPSSATKINDRTISTTNSGN